MHAAPQTSPGQHTSSSTAGGTKPTRAGSSPPAAPQGRGARRWCLALSRAAPRRHLARQSVRPVFWEGNKTPYGAPIWAEGLPGKEGRLSQAHGVLPVPPTPVLLPAGHPPRPRAPCGPGAGPAGAGGAGTGWGGSTAPGGGRAAPVPAAGDFGQRLWMGEVQRAAPPARTGCSSSVWIQDVKRL